MMRWNAQQPALLVAKYYYEQGTLFQGKQSISWIIEFIHFSCSSNKHFSFNYLSRDRTAQLSVLKCEKKKESNRNFLTPWMYQKREARGKGLKYQWPENFDFDFP